MAQEALSGIDVQLKRRFDLIPNLVETVKGYAQHEKSVLEKVTALRAQSLHARSVEEKAAADGNLTQALKTLFAVAENYPQLKANENFIALQKDLAAIEDELQLSRRYYNGTVRNYTIGTRKFPSNLIAKMGNFTPYPYFQVDNETERKTPQVKF
jgi:LemA protein